MVFKIDDYDSFKAAIDEICAFLSSRAVAEERVFDCKLVSHELIGNVLQHSGGGAVLEVELDDAYIRLTVRAEKPFCPPDKGECPQTDAERGRGLYLVDCVCAERVFTADGCIGVLIPIQ